MKRCWPIRFAIHLFQTLSLIGFLMIWVGVLGVLGCAQHKSAIRTETVEVPKYIKQPVAAQLIAPIVVDKPVPACNDGQSAVYCNGQIAALLVELQHALDTCNADRKAIRDGQ